jgi:hypothetical protein
MIVISSSEFRDGELEACHHQLNHSVWRQVNRPGGSPEVVRHLFPLADSALRICEFVVVKRARPRRASRIQIKFGEAFDINVCDHVSEDV